VLSNEVDELKSKAHRFLRKAQEVCGVSTPEDKPDIAKAFTVLPNTLEEVEDLIHELKAQAEACVGTDQSVGVVILFTR
jgi:hypothetical protein